MYPTNITNLQQNQLKEPIKCRLRGKGGSLSIFYINVFSHSIFPQNWDSKKPNRYK